MNSAPPSNRPPEYLRAALAALVGRLYDGQVFAVEHEGRARAFCFCFAGEELPDIPGSADLYQAMETGIYVMTEEVELADLADLRAMKEVGLNSPPRWILQGHLGSVWSVVKWIAGDSADRVVQSLSKADGTVRFGDGFEAHRLRTAPAEDRHLEQAITDVVMTRAERFRG